MRIFEPGNTHPLDDDSLCRHCLSCTSYSCCLIYLFQTFSWTSSLQGRCVLPIIRWWSTELIQRMYRHVLNACSRPGGAKLSKYPTLPSTSVPLYGIVLRRRTPSKPLMPTTPSIAKALYHRHRLLHVLAAHHHPRLIPKSLLSSLYWHH